MDESIRIKRMKLVGESYRIWISTLEKPLQVSPLLVHSFRLKEGIVLTEPQLEQLTREAEIVECDRVAARLLAIRDHTAGELAAKLKRRKFQKESIDRTIATYRERGIIDDAHVASRMVQQSLERNPSGRAHLVAQLRRKHIDRDLAEQTVNMALEGTDEVVLAVESLQKRWSSFKDLELERARTKAYNYLSRRGISYGAARSAFEHVYNLKEEVSDD